MRRLDERASGAAKMFVFAMDDLQLSPDVQPLDVYGSQGLSSHFIPDSKVREKSNAQPALHRLLRDARVISLHYALDFYADVMQRRRNSRLRPRSGLTKDEFFPLQVAYANLSSFGKRVFRSHH